MNRYVLIFWHAYLSTDIERERDMARERERERETEM
jgi:hypothetical protein